MSRRWALFALIVTMGCSSPTTAPDITAPADAGTWRIASPVASVLFARRAPVAVARTGDHKLRMLSLPDGREIRSIDYGDRAVVASDLSQDGQLVAIGDWTGLVSVWATASGERRYERRLRKYPGLLTFSPDGRRLATAAQGDAVQILDSVTGALVTTLGSPVGGTLALAFSRDGAWVATGDGDTAVRIHNAATGKEAGVNREFLMVPLAVAFSADGASVFAASGDKFLTIIDRATGRTARKLDRATQPVQGLDVSPDGKTMAMIFMKSEDMTLPDHIVVRTLDTWQTLVDWLPPTMPIGGAWTNDGRLIVALASADGVQLWRLR